MAANGEILLLVHGQKLDSSVATKDWIRSHEQLHPGRRGRWREHDHRPGRRQRSGRIEGDGGRRMHRPPADETNRVACLEAMDASTPGEGDG